MVLELINFPLVWVCFISLCNFYTSAKVVDTLHFKRTDVRYTLKMNSDDFVGDVKEATLLNGEVVTAF
jgi:hypothetical protein